MLLRIGAKSDLLGCIVEDLVPCKECVFVSTAQGTAAYGTAIVNIMIWQHPIFCATQSTPALHLIPVAAATRMQRRSNLSYDSVKAETNKQKKVRGKSELGDTLSHAVQFQESGIMSMH